MRNLKAIPIKSVFCPLWVCDYPTSGRFVIGCRFVQHGAEIPVSVFKHYLRMSSESIVCGRTTRPVNLDRLVPDVDDVALFDVSPSPFFHRQALLIESQ